MVESQILALFGVLSPYFRNNPSARPFGSKISIFRYTRSVSSLIPTDLTLHIPLSGNFLVGVFLTMFVVWFIHMIIVRYHWKNYGNDKLLVVKMNIIYFTGSAVLFGALALSLIAYSSSTGAL